MYFVGNFNYMNYYNLFKTVDVGMRCNTNHKVFEISIIIINIFTVILTVTFVACENAFVQVYAIINETITN